MMCFLSDKLTGKGEQPHFWDRFVLFLHVQEKHQWKSKSIIQNRADLTGATEAKEIKHLAYSLSHSRYKSLGNVKNWVWKSKRLLKQDTIMWVKRTGGPSVPQQPDGTRSLQCFGLSWHLIRAGEQKVNSIGTGQQHIYRGINENVSTPLMS